MALFTLSYCPECGESRIPHGVDSFGEKIGELITSIPGVSLVTSVMNEVGVRLRTHPLTTRLSRTLFTTLVQGGVLSHRTEPLHNESTRILALYEGAVQ